MLSEKQNRTITQVGRGTPMGELLRRYWMPIAAVAELDDNPIEAGAAAWARTSSSTGTGAAPTGWSIATARTAAPISRYGMVEECGLRCNYHGWLFDHTGRCLQQPFEEIAHPGRALQGPHADQRLPRRGQGRPAVGLSRPAPAPLVPDWEPFTWTNGFVQIVFSEIPCNWFQCQENSIDPVHFEWLHSQLDARAARAPAAIAPPTHSRSGFDEFEWGFVYRRIREGTVRGGRAVDGGARAASGRTACSPATTSSGACRSTTSTRSASAGSSTACRTSEEPFVQERIPYWTRADQGSRRPGAGSPPRHEPGLRRLGRPGDDRRPHAGAPRRERPRRHPDAPPLLEEAERWWPAAGNRRA